MPEMVFEYILKNNGIDPAADLEIDQSIDFGSTAAAFTGDASAAFTVEFEPSATALEKEGAGYVVASLGVDSGYVPYTSYSAKTSFLNENPQVIQSFTTALQKGMDYVQSHTPEEIAQVIAPQFPETDLDTLTIIVTRYYEQDTWKDNLVFEQDSFELLQDILESAGELSERVDYEQLMLDLEEELRSTIRYSADPLKTALIYARTGNYIDFAALPEVSQETALALIKSENKDTLDEQEYKNFCQDMKKAANVVYITDNCGEIVLDKLAISVLKKTFPNVRITALVRGLPAGNDATMEDAEFCGLTDLVPVLGNGSQKDCKMAADRRKRSQAVQAHGF